MTQLKLVLKRKNSWLHDWSWGIGHYGGGSNISMYLNDLDLVDMNGEGPWTFWTDTYHYTCTI